MTYLGGPAQKGYLFQASCIYNYERIEISQVEKYERAGKSMI